VREAVHKLKKKKKKMDIQKEGESVDIHLFKEVFTEQIQIRLKLGSSILLVHQERDRDWKILGH